MVDYSYDSIVGALIEVVNYCLQDLTMKETVQLVQVEWDRMIHLFTLMPMRRMQKMLSR